MITDKILDSSKYVVDNSKHVKINTQKLDEFSKNIKAENVEHWLKSSPIDINKFSLNQRVNFLLIMHSIGFSYWGIPKWAIEYKGRLFDGSYGMVVALFKAIENNYPILNYDYLANISENDFSKILAGNVQIPLFAERLKIIREMGNIVNERFEGDFMNVLSEVNSDVDLLNIIIDNFPSFNDKSNYKDKEILFYKRAQLLVADIFQVMPEQRFGIQNLRNLTACADYKIPQILRHFGILEYSLELADMIDNKIELKKSSEEEVEIRANMIYAIEVMKEFLRDKFEDINSIMIDDQLWILSQTYKCNNPYHLIRTTSY